MDREVWLTLFQVVERLAECTKSLVEVKNGVEKGEASRSWCKKYLECFDTLSRHSSDFAYELQLDELPEDCIIILKYANPLVSEPDPSIETISLVLEIINHSCGTIGKFHGQWDSLATWVNRISALFAWLTGFLYITARLILLAVAFAAFRKQNEDLYIDTWTRFMPSWR